MKRTTKRSAEDVLEVMKRLVKEPDFARQFAGDRDAQRTSAVTANSAVLKPLLSELAQVGWKVGSLDELRMSGRRYSSAVPVLIDWLPKLQSNEAQEAVVRALSVPWAGELALDKLVTMFSEPRLANTSLKWAIGSAIEVLANKNVINKLVKIAADRSHGRSREMIVLALGKIRTDLTKRTLLGLLKDEEVCGHAVAALRRMGATDAQDFVRRLSRHEKKWVRDEVKKFLREA
jgi:HEAT repeat protein